MMTLFTEITERHAQFKQIEWSGEMPPCQVHYMSSQPECPHPGVFDSPTPAGPWADLCTVHIAAFTTPNSKAGFHRIKKVLPSVD